MDLALLISILALLGTVSANVIAERARRSAASAESRSCVVSAAQKRTEVLLELETQRSKLQTLKIVLSTKLTLLRRHQPLAEANVDEVQRLENNIQSLRELLDRHDTEVTLAEDLGADSSIVAMESMLANVKRLTIRATEDLRNEEVGLEVARREVERVGA
jgi:hypothetical protein